MSIPKNVSFIYEVPYGKIRELYREATLVVIPIREMKRSSGQMTLTDTMQAGVALIISNVTGIAHYNMRDKQNAILVKPGDPEELKDAISNLVKDKLLRNTLSTNIKKAGTSYSTKNYAIKLTSAIGQTVQNPKLCAISKTDLKYLRNIRNKNNQFFLNSTQITNKQQRDWYESYLQKEKSGKEYMFILQDVSTNYGTGAIYNINQKNKTAEIGRFIVDEEFRGKGYGDILLKQIIELAFKKLALKKVYLEVLFDNKQAIGLYNRHKFATVEKFKKSGKQILKMELLNSASFK